MAERRVSDLSDADIAEMIEHSRRGRVPRLVLALEKARARTGANGTDVAALVRLEELTAQAIAEYEGRGEFEAKQWCLDNLRREQLEVLKPLVGLMELPRIDDDADVEALSATEREAREAARKARSEFDFEFMAAVLSCQTVRARSCPLCGENEGAARELADRGWRVLPPADPMPEPVAEAGSPIQSLCRGRTS